MRYWDSHQKDALSTTDVSYSNVELEPYLLRGFSVSKKTSISPFIKGNLRLNMDSAYLQGNQSYLDNLSENDFAGWTQRDFYQEVILRDTELFSKHELAGSFGAWLHFKQHNNMKFSLKVEGGYRTALESLHRFEEH